MSRNQSSRFAINPTNLDISRSRFNSPFSVKTSLNVGSIVPLCRPIEILPGDTLKIKSAKVIRMQTLKTPIMDNLYFDTYYFFVPNRIVWEHWKQFQGENTQSAWLPSTTYQVPQITAPSGGWNIGTIADYFGLPTGVGNISVNALPFRAYAKIMDEWFRDENFLDPLNIPVSDATVTGSNGSTFVNDVAKGGVPYLAAKYYDYFTGCLPAPQKGPDVMLPLGTNAPVYTGADNPTPLTKKEIRFGTVDGTALSSTYSELGLYKDTPNTNGYGIEYPLSSSPSGAHAVYPTNLYTDLSLATGSSVNQLRLAFAVQKLYEKDARGGTRYTEILKSHFGVTSPDARQQRPEYLGGNRVPITINQILQSSGSVSGQTPQGTTTGQSLTVDQNYDFTKSFTEHGFVICVGVARYDHTYQDGIARFWSRKTRFDYYMPVFANIGEMAVLNKEIYAQGSSVVNPNTGKAYDDEVFGYQEAWCDYRHIPNMVSGQMRSSAGTYLDTWHLADDYSSMPYLSNTWISEDPSTVDRVLCVAHSVSDQFFLDAHFSCEFTRAMPLYSIPGLIDHH